jgi:hypothetical protein
MQFNQQSQSIQAKRRLLKCQSIINQLKDEYEQINWPDMFLEESIDFEEVYSRINYISKSIQNYLEII